LDRDSGCSSRDVEDARRTMAHDRVDHRAAPPPVLPERQRLFEEVVMARQPFEEPLGEAVRIVAQLRVHEHASRHGADAMLTCSRRTVQST
jgi:hypothetical protein